MLEPSTHGKNILLCPLILYFFDRLQYLSQYMPVRVSLFLTVTLHCRNEPFTNLNQSDHPHLHAVINVNFVTLNSCDRHNEEEECEEMPTFQRHVDFKSYI